LHGSPSSGSRLTDESAPRAERGHAIRAAGVGTATGTSCPGTTHRFRRLGRHGRPCLPSRGSSGPRSWPAIVIEDSPKMPIDPAPTPGCRPASFGRAGILLRRLLYAHEEHLLGPLRAEVDEHRRLALDQIEQARFEHAVLLLADRPGGPLGFLVHGPEHLGRGVRHAVVVVAADDAVLIHGELEDVVRRRLI